MKNLWIVYYKFNGTNKYKIYQAKNSWDAKEKCIKENNFNNIEIIEVETCENYPKELIEEYKNKIAPMAV